jgi:glycosyltransferase involved in cell wall biosynthesis
MTAAKTKQRRLLFLLNDAPFFVTHRLAVAIAARAAGWEVHVAAPDDEEAVKIITAAGVIHHDAPLARGGTNPFSEFKLMRAYWKLIRRLRPDLVHAVTMKPGAYGAVVARLLGVPALVVAVTGLGFLFLRDTPKTRLLRWIVLRLYGFGLGHKNCRAIFQNPDDRALFERRNLIGATPVHIIRGCGVDLAVFAPRPEPDGPPIVVFPARLIDDKGIREFLVAARTARDKGLDARFRLVGRTDADNPTDVGEATIRRWEAAGLVEWLGFADDMPKMFAACHIVCLPSYREGLPRTLIEAAACGRAIVTSDAPGCRDVVVDGDNGLLAPVRDGGAVADAVIRLIEDPALRRRMAARGRAIAEADFSVELFVAQSLKVYDEVAP